MMRLVLRLLAPLAFAGLVVLPGPAAASASYQVQMRGYAFSPAVLTVRAGATVTWTNFDQAPHDVVTTSAPRAIRSPLLRKGGMWRFTFTVPGTYSYYCSIHPDMRAQVVVLPASTPAPATSRHASGGGAHAKGSVGSPKSTAAASAGTPPPKSPGTGQSPLVAPAASGEPKKSLNPMLPLVGLVSAVAVFCLLLLTSRPAPTDD